MKRLFLLFVAMAILISGCAGLPKPKQLYTSCNIWVHNHMKCINYKIGKYIPAGTEVHHVKSIYNNPNYMFIFFKTIGHNESYKMRFIRRWHPGKTTKDYIKYLFTEKSFDELVEGMTGPEIDAIKQGKIVVGMSKKAVLVSYGRPPEHRTPDLNSDKWIYWMNKLNQKTLCFDENDKTTWCHNMTLDGFKPQNTQSDFQKLLELKQLKDKGIISTEEYEQKKKKYLLKY